MEFNWIDNGFQIPHDTEGMRSVSVITYDNGHDSQDYSIYLDMSQEKAKERFLKMVESQELNLVEAKIWHGYVEDELHINTSFGREAQDLVERLLDNNWLRSD